MTSTALEQSVTVADAVVVDQQMVLRSLGLDPRDPKTHAVVAVCQRYGLDPVLKHVVVVDGNTYVTRDGLLAVAHRSGQLDGIEIVATGDTGDEWTATVAVHRKDMTHPFTFPGRYPKMQHTRNGDRLHPYGPEMAIKCAESHALRRAFDVAGLAAIDEITTPISTGPGIPHPGPVDTPPDPDISDRIAVLRTKAGQLDPDRNEHWAAWRDEHGFDPRDPTVVDLLDAADTILDALLTDQGQQPFDTDDDTPVDAVIVEPSEEAGDEPF